MVFFFMSTLIPMIDVLSPSGVSLGYPSDNSIGLIDSIFLQLLTSSLYFCCLYSLFCLSPDLCWIYTYPPLSRAPSLMIPFLSPEAYLDLNLIPNGNPPSDSTVIGPKILYLHYTTPSLCRWWLWCKWSGILNGSDDFFLSATVEKDDLTSSGSLSVEWVCFVDRGREM